KYKAVVEKVERTRHYEPTEAAALMKEVSTSKFDGTVEASVKIGYKSLQNVRGIVRLPHGTGKEVRVLVFAKEDKQAEAKAAGADFVGGTEMVEKILKEGWTDFDACVATPDLMKDVGKLGAILGRKGLMPKPKAGTVTTDVGTAVKNLKSGQMEYRPDKTGVIHVRIGRVSFTPDKIEENMRAVFAAITRDRPSDAKGEYVRSFYVSPTMGPAARVNIRAMAT
ncbi:MAG TPA: 50S ribosomal protein L1, partial [Leptospiraceae bacterium]|nr:50S ribosomal protein L1 [Leptospiraceae bacterium]